ncbi:MAG: FtsQ-type POTRA domain-containing protein [Peptoniphilus lacydonensis]|uniref:cell division protein FtsQ/DivIB n=1 Tax=Peptoniphilus lacydonensis TaxID=1673725 RepID=UPI00290511B5|nr:FtsQ-type POTRA domain-containing protein [Peptoniphilus lacydonensis]MDU2115829.1 FtsQ-type POTRA domain-containing protein [Peptoniphilus lacydonensis]MDU7302708.1 FtsQ-type POTRA domain-containing protein [Peptoniphilus lacydonensis]
MKKSEKKKRKLNKKKKYFKIFSRFFIFFSFIFLLVFAIKNSNIFSIKNVVVEGNKVVSADTIKKVSGLKKGNKYFYISKRERLKKIKSIPYIKDAKISYNIIGRVKVVVSERTAYYQIESNEYLIVDENFRIIAKLDKKEENLVNLMGFNVENSEPGSYILSNKEDKEKRDLLMELRSEEYSLRGNIRDIELLDSIATFTTVEGIKVEFGSYSNTSYKLKMLSLILDDIKKTNKNAILIQMEKGDSPILITDGEEDNKSKKEEKDKSYREVEKN